ncbi:MAG: hypothetical protein ACOY3P_07915 [Planctomycetota bacterium]
MNLAIVHYHLSLGGVTQVIAHQLRALAGVAVEGESCRVAILHGGRSDGWPAEVLPAGSPIKVALHTIPQLRYDDGHISARDLAGRLGDALRDLGFAAEDSVIHVHNHSLGKNSALPGAIRELAARGFRLLLQIHDFAEDCRPRNYAHLVSNLGAQDLSATLYPQSPQIHYAVLNRRDFRILQAAGVDTRRLHYLPNAVPPAAKADRGVARRRLKERFAIAEDRSFVLYPVRGIRRKNAGEMLLCAALFGDCATFGMTLAPQNPLEKDSYRQWTRLADELNLAARFEMGGGHGLPLPENMAACDAALTTSVAEGFGMAFLESWLADRPLVGRNLPEITEDFVVAGLRFENLYAELRVPVELVGAGRYRSAWLAAYSRMLQAYGQEVSGDVLVPYSNTDAVDFAMFDAPLQEVVIRRAHADASVRDAILAVNPQLAPLREVLVGRGPEATVELNRRVVRSEYAPSASGARLKDLYRQVLTSESVSAGAITGPRAGERILAMFLEPGRFHPLRTG